ncbi:MAG: hypothetical protein OXR73_02630, partial [Myxococcales bacterium]|nr:hypothetical protein [Myxococcales bacterium]
MGATGGIGLTTTSGEADGTETSGGASGIGAGFCTLAEGTPWGDVGRRLADLALGARSRRFGR